MLFRSFNLLLTGIYFSLLHVTKVINGPTFNRAEEFAEFSVLKLEKSRGAWLAVLLECATLDLGVVSSSPCCVWRLLKNKIFRKKTRKFSGKRKQGRHPIYDSSKGTKIYCISQSHLPGDSGIIAS